MVANSIFSKGPLTQDYGQVWESQTKSSIEEISEADVLSAFKENGVLLFRGFSVSTATFKSFTDQVCPGFMNYEGGASARSKVDGESTVLSVTEPTMLHPIPLHGEMYYTKRKPSTLFFYCEKPADVDGETTVADGVEIFKKLQRQTRKFFTDNRIKYICTYPDGRWQQLFKTDTIDDVKAYCEQNELTVYQHDDNSIVTEYRAAAISTPLYCSEPAFINNIFTMVRWEQAGFNLRIVRDENGDKLPAEIIDDIQRVERDLTLPVKWQPGDVLMVDNSRMLHGRRGFEDTSRAIFVRLGGELTSTQ
ncbi:MAG: TauD/TfdA family dioxygenase [Pseudomonadota bacterium]